MSESISYWSETAKRLAKEFWGKDVSDIERVQLGHNHWTWRLGSDFYLHSAAAERHAHTEREIEIRAFLAHQRFPWAVPRTVPAMNGGNLVNEAERDWWITVRVPGRHPDPASAADTAAVARAIGAMHAVLADAVLGDLRLPEGPSMTWAPSATEFITRHAHRFTQRDLDLVTAAAAEFSSRWAAIDQSMQPVHGDPAFPNILVESSPGPSAVTGILDWEQVSLDFPLVDLATVGTSVIFWSGLPDARSQLDHVLANYKSVRDVDWTVADLLAGMLGCKLESLVHHGRRYLSGQGPQDMMTGQPELISRVLSLLRKAS